MNVITGEVSNPVESTVAFPAIALTADKLPEETFPVEGYKLLAMNYLLTGKGTIDCSLKFNNDVTAVTVNAAPVNVNYRTNIYGSLFTAPGTFNIIIDPNWDGDYNDVKVVNTTSDLLAAIADNMVSEIRIESPIDLSSATQDELTLNTGKTIRMAEGASIKLGGENNFVVNDGLTVTGGEITNTGTEGKGSGYAKVLIVLNDGELNLSGTTLTNDPTYHWHGGSDPDRMYNTSAIIYRKGKINIDNCTIVSGMFTLCGMRADNDTELTCTNSTFESTSSNGDNGKNWAYCMRISGKTAVFNDCVVKGIQGGISPEAGVQCTINGGTYYTENTPGKTDAFYAVYVTDNAVVTINSGNFHSPNVRTNLPIGGTSCLVSGDNDTGLPTGSIILNGGKVSGKAYNINTASVYEPAAGKIYKALTDDDPYKFEIVAQ